jgi:NDP-sugar pyrophosphorylase family protein
VHELELPASPVLVTNGDELKGLPLKTLGAFHAQRKTEHEDYAATVALIRVPNPSDYGVAEMDGALIARFHEKPELPPSTLVSSGLYVIEPAMLEELKGGAQFLMFEKDFFPVQAERRALGGCALVGPWYDCGTLDRWERAIQEWREPI